MGLVAGVLIMLTVMVFFSWTNQPSEQSRLEAERQTLTDELLVLGRKLLHRELSQDLFDSISREKQEELLAIETKMAQVYWEEASEIMKTAKDRLEWDAGSVPDEERVAEEIADGLMKKESKKGKN